MLIIIFNYSNLLHFFYRDKKSSASLPRYKYIYIFFIKTISGDDFLNLVHTKLVILVLKVTKFLMYNPNILVELIFYTITRKGSMNWPSRS